MHTYVRAAFVGSFALFALAMLHACVENRRAPTAPSATSVELTAAAIFNQVPVHGTYVLDATLITKENAKNYYFPDSPF